MTVNIQFTINTIESTGTDSNTVYLSGNYGNDTIKNVEIIYIGDEKVFDSTATAANDNQLQLPLAIAS